MSVHATNRPVGLPGGIKNILGQTYGYLTVTRFLGVENRRSSWECKCACGSYVIRSIDNLTSEQLKRPPSCGCNGEPPVDWEEVIRDNRQDIEMARYNTRNSLTTRQSRWAK